VSGQPSRYLLDVHTVLALLDPTHVFHDAAHAWAEADPDSRWLTCPIVQNGVLRVASQPRYTNSLGTVSAVRDLVRAFTAHPGHEFLADDVTLLDDHIVRPERLTPASTTDVYLLLLAQQHGAKLATFDRRLPVDAIDGGTEAIEVIGV